MIKNVKITLGRLCLLFISIIGVYFCNNVNGACSDYNLNNGVDYCYDVGSTYYLPCNTIDSNCSFSFDSYGNFYGDLNYFGTITQMYGDYYYNAFGWVDGTFRKLYSQGSSYAHYYLFTGGCYGDSSHISDYGARNYSCDHGSSYNSTWLSSDSFSDLSLWGNIDIILNSRADSWSQFCFVGESVNEVLCFTNGTPSEELSVPNISLPYNFINIGSNFFGSSPFGSSGGSSNDNSIIYQEGNTLNNTISYYENILGWDQNICYVGINDITSPYGTAGISFQYGTGETIFGLYNGLYSGFGSNIIQNVGRFVNTWLINYSQWFATSPSNRLYLASYNGPGSNVTLYYTGLTFPYSGQPVAIYFMSDLIYNEYSNASTQGEEVAYYCYLKLNKSSIEDGIIDFEDVQDLVTPGIIGRINDNVNSYLTGRVGFLVPDFSGSVWGDIGSGFDGDVDPSNMFEGFYNDILGIVNRGNYTGNGILPTWIIYPLLFLILFRILKH